MDVEWVKILVTVLLAILGWLFVAWVNARRDVANSRRELVVQHLLGAYKILTQEFGRRDNTIDSITKFENLLSEIQLFGSLEQIRLAQELSEQTANEWVSEIDPLIEELRESLRKELRLKPTTGTTIWLRFTDDFKSQLRGDGT